MIEAAEIIPASLSDPLFRFEEERHLYWYGDRPLVSATTWLKKFKEPFDAEGIAARVANKRKVSPEVVRAEWDAAREEGSRLGNLVHDAIEATVRGEIPVLEDPEAQARYQQFRKLMDNRLAGATFPACELRMFSLRYGIAGTLDMLVKLPTGKLYIGDWKTNKKFRMGLDGYSRLLNPFDHLMDNEANSYAIQVALYRIMLEEHGLKTDGSFIGYLGPRAKEAMIYFPPDLRPYVRGALNMEAA